MGDISKSWSRQAKIFAAAGFRVVAIDFRGRGQSRGGQRWSEGGEPDEGVHFDVLDQGDRSMQEILRFLSGP